MKEHHVGDKVRFLGVGGTQGIEGMVTYVIRDGSNPPWGYIMVHSNDETSHICSPGKLVPVKLTDDLLRIIAMKSEHR